MSKLVETRISDLRPGDRVNFHGAKYEITGLPTLSGIDTAEMYGRPVKIVPCRYLGSEEKSDLIKVLKEIKEFKGFELKKIKVYRWKK